MGIKNLLNEESFHSIEEVLAYARDRKEYEYIWAQQLNEVILNRLEGQQIACEKLLEARIFGNGHEIHIFRQDDWMAVETVDWKENYYDETQKIKKADKKRYGTAITIRHYIDFDEDEQAYICGSCLNGWEA